MKNTTNSLLDLVNHLQADSAYYVKILYQLRAHVDTGPARALLDTALSYAEVVAVRTAL